MGPIIIDCLTIVDPTARGGSKGGLGALQLVHQWKNEKGEGEEEVEKRRKM
jgi:hypothetical protein